MGARRIGWLTLIALASLACDSVTQVPIAFPARAYAGETVSFALSTDWGGLPDSNKAHDVSEENVEIRVLDPSSSVCAVVTPRSVIAATSALPTAFAEQNGAAEIVIATLDLPDSLSPPCTIPGTVRLAAHRLPGGELIGGRATVEILGSAAQGNGPTSFVPGNALTQLRPRPSLRLRAVEPGFDGSWVIGSVQFEVTYPVTVSNPRAFARLEAAKGVAYAHEIAPGVARVLVVDPRGFELPWPFASQGELGGGPFVDIIFNQTEAFETTDFTISNLIVTDVDGTVLVDNPGDSSSFFQVFARANQ